MGVSAPPPATIDLIGSYARRRGNDVEIILWEPTEALGASSVVLLRAGVEVEGSVDLVEDEHGKRLVCRASQGLLTDGQWKVQLVDTAGRHRVAARLLVQGRRPVVLLWGGRASSSEVPRAQRRPALQQRVVRTGGSVVDSALKALPPDRAIAVRSTLRRTARKILQ